MIRQKVLREIAAGAFHPKEEVMLAELFAAFEQGDERGHRGAVGACASRALPCQAEGLALVKRDDAAERGPEWCDVGEEMNAVSLAERVDSGKHLRYAST